MLDNQVRDQTTHISNTRNTTENCDHCPQNTAQSPQCAAPQIPCANLCLHQLRWRQASRPVKAVCRAGDSRGINPDIPPSATHWSGYLASLLPHKHADNAPTTKQRSAFIWIWSKSSCFEAVLIISYWYFSPFLAAQRITS